MTTRPTLPQNLVTSDGIILDPCNVVEDYTVTGQGGIELDYVNFLVAPSLKLNVTTAHGTVTAKKTISWKRQILQDSFQLWVHPNTDQETTILKFSVVFTNAANGTMTEVIWVSGSSFFPKCGERIVLPLNDFTAAGGATWNDTFVSVSFILAAMTDQVCSVSISEFVVGHRNIPVVTIGFDDAFDGVYNLAFPIMDALGLPGVAYVITSYVGKSVGGYERMTLANLRELQAAGWDIANHCYDEPWLDTLTQEKIDKQIGNSQTWLVQNGFGDAAYHLAYPAGRYDSRVVETCERLGVVSARTTITLGQSYPPANWYALNAYGRGTVSSAAYTNALAAKINAGQSLNLFYHNVIEGATTTIHLNVDTFRSDMQWLAQAHAAGIIRVATMTELMKLQDNPRYRSLPVGRSPL